MALLEKIERIKLNDDNKSHLEFTVEDYRKYLDMLKSMDPKMLKYFLELLKDTEVIQNQEADIQDPLFLATYSKLQRVTSLDKIVALSKKNQGKLEVKDLIHLHTILMKGTTEDFENGLRTDNNRFVGFFNNDGSKNIDYIPIDYQDIQQNLEQFLEYYNNADTDNPFVVPIIAHGILAVMQAFNDGNTRLSRLIQHSKIWQLTNELYGVDLRLPALYLSKNYLCSLGQYRNLQKELAKNDDDEAWNRWIRYNLNMADEQLFYLDNNVKRLIKQSN